MGRNHIPRKNASVIDEFYEQHLNLYLPYHRVCSYSTDKIDKRGKVVKKYDQHMTPYECLKHIGVGDP